MGFEWITNSEFVEVLLHREQVRISHMVSNHEMKRKKKEYEYVLQLLQTFQNARLMKSMYIMIFSSEAACPQDFESNTL